MSWVQTVLNTIASFLQHILEVMSPFYWIEQAARYVVSFLPPPDPRVADLLTTTAVTLASFFDWIALADYFVNLSVFMMVISIMAMMETVLAVPRLCRFLRSLFI